MNEDYENDNIEQLEPDNIDNLESESTEGNGGSSYQPSVAENSYQAKPQKYGQKEYEKTLNNKNYYKDKQKELDDKKEEAEKRKKEASATEKSYKNAKDAAKKGKKEEGGKENYKARKNDYKKAKWENKEAKKDYKQSKRDSFNNKVDGLKSDYYKTAHPIDALKARAKNKFDPRQKLKNKVNDIKDAAKNKAKTAAKEATKKAAKATAKAGKAAAKATVKATSAIIKFLASNPYILLGIAIFIGILSLVILIVVIFQDEDDLGATNANNVKIDYNVNGINSNTKVQLVNYDATAEQFTVIETIDLEKYIAGVAISNMGRNYNDEAMKSYIIAVRSHLFASVGTKNQTALKITDNLNMIYNDEEIIGYVDEGIKKVENETLPSNNLIKKIDVLSFDRVDNVIRVKNTSDSLTYWDYENSLYRSKISEDKDTYIYSPEYTATQDDQVYQTKLLSSELEKYNLIISEVLGMYALDSSGNVLNVDCSSTSIQNLNTLATNNANSENGKYTAVLMKNYNNMAKVEAARVERMYYGEVGEFSTWKQKTKLGAPWGKVKIGTVATIDSVGCLITSISMQIANSGVPTGEILDFNPGTFAKAIKAKGCLSNGGGINSYDCLKKAVPAFSYAGRVYTSGSNEQKYQKVKEYADQGYYIVLEVRKKTGGQHWVALDAKNSNFANWRDLFIWDPATNKTSIGSYNKYNLGEFIYFKANKESN